MKSAVASSLSLDALLSDFDGRRAEFLDRLAADWPADERFLLRLARFAAQADTLPQLAATGLLKRYAAAGVVFSASVTAALLELLPTVVHWEARLQLLQILPALTIPAGGAAAALDEYLRQRLAIEQNRFVRVWIYAGLHRLASLHAGYRPGIRALLKRAAHEEAASVRARLRRLPDFE